MASPLDRAALAAQQRAIAAQTREAIREASPSGEEGRKYRIKMVVTISMISIAVFFDGLQFLATFLNVIPGLGVMVGWFLGALAEIGFAVWFLLLGAWQGPGGKGYAVRLLIMMGTVITELAPLIQALPAITLGVLALIFVVRAEDELGIKKISELKDMERTAMARVVAARQRVAERDIAPLALYGGAAYQARYQQAVVGQGAVDSQESAEADRRSGRTEYQELQRQRLASGEGSTYRRLRRESLGRDERGEEVAEPA